MKLFRKKGSIRNIQGENYGRIVIPGGRTKLISTKNGKWAQIYKKTIRRFK